MLNLINRLRELTGNGEKTALPPPPDLESFHAAYAAVSKRYGSPEFFRSISKHLPGRHAVSHEEFLYGWNRPVDAMVFEEVTARLKTGRFPRMLEVGCGFTVGSGLLHGAPWESRRLVSCLGENNVVASTFNDPSALLTLCSSGVLLDKNFERNQFGLQAATRVNFHELDYSNKGAFDIIFGRCLDPSVFNQRIFQENSSYSLLPGGKAIIELQHVMGPAELLIFERHPEEPRLQLISSQRIGE